MATPGDDDTIRLPRAAAPRPAPPVPSRRGGSGWLIPALAGVSVLAACAGGAVWFLRPVAPDQVVERPAPPPAPDPARIATATEAEILANRAPDLVVRRLADNPAILVLDFPTLARQGRMLNRIAALVEKSGLPRDRVLDDAALAAAIEADGGSADTFYYGHNYRAADVARFFLLADRDGVRLNEEEERLRALADRLGWLETATPGAVVSIPAQGAEPWLDAAARATMLRHELSHGEFFTNPAYAALTWRFWREMLTEAERARLRDMLAHAAYDPALEEVMANEAQAFLFHTPDERFFSASTIGFAPQRLAELRAAFVAEMPPGWLRDATAPR
jgi:hypothetical protein